jgi:predicted nucleic acid-binding protein
MALPPLPLRERRVFVDSSVYLALLDEDDEHHREAIQVLNLLAEARYRQYTTSVLLIASHADATSFAVMERLGIRLAFTFDRDFAQYGFTVLPVQ